ncbi:hypothetical protein [Lishizhenia tianjinensis]|nr:hypothetical protein [Lishizhenia tianjinensis]
MKNWMSILLLSLCLLLSGGMLYGQTSNLHSYFIPAKSDTIILDSLSIYSCSFQVFCGQDLLPSSDYYLDAMAAKFVLYTSCNDSLKVKYRTFDVNFTQRIQNKDTSLIYRANKTQNQEDFLYTAENKAQDIFGSGIQKSGSISRGIAFGNNQDLSVNSTLNLQLSGDLAPNLKILASVSDDNIPIQPDGNTNKLQEFDQIFIQVYNDKVKLIAGDFWVKKPTGYFMNYNKRAQGLYGQYSWSNQENTRWTVQGSGALSKGKFARNIIQGVEGNQGPYRLRGNENEPYIIVLSGTEKVYLDGKLLERGQEFDYTINYNTAELTFTSRNFITKDVRIIVEFQYSDQNYARSLFQTSLNYESKKLDYWFNAYSEQDAKNQNLQQQLSFADRQLLASVGDSLTGARTSSIDSVAFSEQRILYALKDSLGIDSVLVYSVNPNTAHFTASFAYVGPNQGNYVFDQYTALGKVYRWVAPVGGVPQGDYSPSRVLIPAKQQNMISSGARYRINKTFSVETELSTTKNDINTFSRLDKDNDNAFGTYAKLIGDFDLSKDSSGLWRMVNEGMVEYRTANYNPIQWYRDVEFDRDWNVRNQPYLGEQLVSNLSANFAHQSKGEFKTAFQSLNIGNDYAGKRLQSLGKWRGKGFNANWDASYLNSNALNTNDYFRHKINLSKSFKYFKIGFIDDHEFNQFYKNKDSVLTTSYEWYDWQVYLGEADTAKNGFQIFYRERYDRRSDSTNLLPAAFARSTGASYNWRTNKHSQLEVLGSYRNLNIRNTDIINAQAENNVVGRIDYKLNLWKRALSANTFYEIGSGLELKKEFLYIQVNAGQGVYTWIDYNNDGIKDLGEFEIAQYQDQAEYIRVFTPSDQYVKTYSNEFNQSFFWRPERLWANKKGALRFLSRFSNQTRFRMLQKTSNLDENFYNPLERQIADTSLISLGSTVRNTFYFNRTNTIFGADYTFQRLENKTLLANGFDARNSTFHQVNARWNIQRKFTLKLESEFGQKIALADYTSGRNYDIVYDKIAPSLSFQPSTTFRLSFETRFENKYNKVIYGGETSNIMDLGIDFKLNQAEKGSLQAKFNYVRITYVGTVNNAIAFEMLESLKPGKNYTWNVNYQRSISKNLQISLQYNGRKSEDNRTIHAGGVEVRAFF